MELVLKTSALSKSYRGTKVVKSVNMHIARGDVYGFIGENGAGKTTIIRMITGLANPTDGDYQLFGANFYGKDIKNARRRMSAVVETPSVYLNMNAVDNLRLQCDLLGVTDLSIINETLDTVGLGYLINSKKVAKNFSLGMKQRLGIAMALVGNPDFIILDEPMNGLDPEGIVDVRELLIKLNRDKNITFLISSHILSELEKVATTFGFIHKGELIKEISAEDLHKECRKCVELLLTDVSSVPTILDKLEGAQSYKILPNNYVRIYGEVEVAKLVEAFTAKNIGINSINTKDESVEEFYLNIMGGKKNA